LIQRVLAKPTVILLKAWIKEQGCQEKRLLIQPQGTLTAELLRMQDYSSLESQSK
jgi:hypothetical protein